MTPSYSEAGSGPAIVLVHGAMQTSQNFEKLAAALAPSYRVVRYDRRGRGRNASGGVDGTPDRLARETEDLLAVAAATEAHFVFGLSSGAIVTMSAARASPSIGRVVLFEPPLTMPEVDAPHPADWADDFLRALAEQRFGEAMAYLLKGTADRGVLGRVPRSVLSRLFDLAVRRRAKTPNGEPLRELLLTVPADIAIQREGSKTLPPYTSFTTPTLLLGGDRSHPSLTRALDALDQALPTARRVTIRGTGHLAADNDGKPDDVARAIHEFLGKPPLEA